MSVSSIRCHAGPNGSALLRATLLVGALLSSACAAHIARKPVVWPDPPDKPRIQFVKAFRESQDLDTTSWARFLRALVGGSGDPVLVQPMGLAISEDGQRLYIADHGQNHVFVADFARRRLTAFAPEEAMGTPFNVALDSDENVYIADSIGKSVIVFTRKGERLRVIGQGDLDRPTGLALDRQRKVLYVADGSFPKSEHHRVLAYDLAGKHLFDLGPKEGPSAKGSGEGQFYVPSYLALDRDGNVYVADTMNFRIQEFGSNGKFLRQFGQNGDSPGAFARLKGLAFDSFGNLYAVDSNVQIFNHDFKELMFFGGYARKLEYFDIPSGIAIDPKTNRIYVCNEFLARINVYDLINTTAADGN